MMQTSGMIFTQTLLQISIEFNTEIFVIAPMFELDT
jgi:hypothetical protein